MAALLRYCEEVLSHCLVVLLLLVALSGCNDPSQTNTTAAESRETKTPGWWPIVECFFLEDVSECLQYSTVRAFVGLDQKDDIRIDTDKETVTLPGEKETGIFEMLGDLVSDGISRIFQDNDKKGEDEEDDEDDDEDDEEADGVQTAESGDSNTIGHAKSRTRSAAGNVHRSLETGRGKKKKKKKKKKIIKKAIIKLIILIILIKLKIAKFLYVFGKFLHFKLVLLIMINTIINIIRFVMEWKKKKQPENIMYSYEQAHHQHHYDEHHHVDPTIEEHDNGWLSGLWSRSGTYDGVRGVDTAGNAHDMAYSAYKPTQNFAKNAQRMSQDSAHYRQTSAQNSAQSVNYESKPAQNVVYYSYVPNSNANGQRSI